MKRQLITMLLGPLLILVSSCKKERQYPVVDPSLQQYYDSFQEEALKRGIEIDFVNSPIEGIIVDDLEDSISGQCLHSESSWHRIRINRKSWTLYSHLKREFLIFHELGHCYLDRRHLDDRDDDGVCESLMHSGSSACFLDYNATTRKRYLDELFDAEKIGL